MPKPKFFFSYRVADEKDFVFRIKDRFEDHYGIDNVFISPDKIPDGTVWAERILVELEKCDVILAIVGPKWSELLDAKGIQEEEDYVVKEISFGLTNDKLVVPIRIKGAQMPAPQSLPEEIRGIEDIQFGEPVNDDSSFRQSVEKRIRYIDDEMTSRGFVWGNVELEGILTLSSREVSNAILDMLEAEPARITLLVRDFLPYFQNLVNDPEDMHVKAGALAVDMLTTIGATLVLASRRELFYEVLDQMRDIQMNIDTVDSRSSDQAEISLALGIGLNTLGALLIREEKFKWLKEFLSFTIERGPQQEMRRGWIHDLYAKVYNANLLKGTRWIKPSLSQIRDCEYMLTLLQNDVDKVRSLLCQFEFVQCLFYRYHGLPLYTDPGYCRFSTDDTLPIVQRILSGSRIRVELFGDDYDSNRLKQCIANQLKSCFTIGDVHVTLWEGNYDNTELNTWGIDRLLQNQWRD